MQLAGRVSYFMLIINEYSSYYQVTFLSSKSMEATLKVFINYHIEAKYQTEKKL